MIKLTARDVLATPVAGAVAGPSAGRRYPGTGQADGHSAAGGLRPDPGTIIGEQPPLGYGATVKALAGCAAVTARLLWRRRMHLPAGQVGTRLRFGDQTCAQVYRETIVDRGPTQDPCVLVVEFRLRAVRGRGHAVFRLESLLNTPLFAGFPGFVSKLWLASDEQDRYRGLYEWDGPQRAQDYARALWRVLALVCVPGSIHYIVLPGLRPGELLERLESLAGTVQVDPAAWWLPVAVR